MPKLPTKAHLAPRIVLAACALGLCSGRAAGDAPVDDGAPAGMVAFFMMTDTGQCPSGWAPATQATGRLIVGVSNSDEVGVKVGTPLGDKEDRAHEHEFTTMVTLPPKSISAADGGNRAGARAQAYPLTGKAAAAPSGLPFIQLLACEKQ